MSTIPTAAEAAKDIANVGTYCVTHGCEARVIGTKPNVACVQHACVAADYVPKLSTYDPGASQSQNAAKTGEKDGFDPVFVDQDKSPFATEYTGDLADKTPTEDE